MGSLLYYERISSGFPADLIASAEVTKGVAVVSVELNVQRRVVCNVIIHSMQQKAVK